MPELKTPQRRGSSVVERIIGNDEVESSILSRGTIFNLFRPSFQSDLASSSRRETRMGRGAGFRCVPAAHH